MVHQIMLAKKDNDEIMLADNAGKKTVSEGWEMCIKVYLTQSLALFQLLSN